MERFTVETTSEKYDFYNEFGSEEFANWSPEDAELMLDLQTAPIGYSVTIGGGASPLYTYTRIA
jgi:hypothetical protein